MDKWAVHLYWRSGMTPVDICIYVAFSYDAAFEFVNQLAFISNKKRGWFVKPWGKKNRHYTYHEDYGEPPQEEPKEEMAPIPLPPPPSPQHAAMWDLEEWQERQKKRRL